MGIIAVAGRKGGIGKSTIAGNLAGEFVDMGRSVIVLDADPQHSLAGWASLGEGILSKCIERIHKGDSEELKTRARKAAGKADIVMIDTPPGMTDTLYEAAMAADLVLLPCGPSPLDMLAIKDALSLTLKARAERRSKKPRIRFVPSRVTNTNLGRGLSSELEGMGKKVLPGITQRVAVAEAVNYGLTVREFAGAAASKDEFRALAKAVEKILDR
ncbi:MAG TPA: ParA family protein [Bryobacteraceae bacterium]|jgi:chromosome partitioning protein|nr:ParA family protein [Bryobacteraceae bacterium]